MAIELDDLQGIMRRMPGFVERHVGPALFVAGNRIQTAAQISLTTGAVSGQNHTPSAPGSAPNNDTGVLANNIETVQVNRLKVQVTSSASGSDTDGGEFGPGKAAAEVSSNAPYAAALEFGTSRVAARPYMAPAANKERKASERIVQQAVKRAVRLALRGAR